MGYECTNPAGAIPSVCSIDCGDGITTSPEQCDDGDEDPGDGCDASCNIETGYE